MMRVFTFIGVTTAQSSIMRIFPRWRDVLGLGTDVEMRGCDLPIHAPAQRYRDTVARLKADPSVLGALITTHKIDLYEAARDLFDDVDAYARLCNEVSCLSKRGGKLLGWAQDPIVAGRSLDAILGPGYFARTGGHVLCLGAGGAGSAITLHLLTRPDPADRPARVVVADRSTGRLDGLRVMHGRLDADVAVAYEHSPDPRVNDALLAALPSGSLVINATGMGKDIPGSPITDAALFPQNGIAWELNYRGERRFLRQARSQREARRLRTEDGWQYFIFGWSTAIEEVFNRPITPAEMRELARVASFVRPPLVEA